MSLSRTILFVSGLYICSLLSADIVGDKVIYGIRVAFQPDDSQGTTGDGSFLLTSTFDTCGTYTIDPPPHDRRYFLSHLQALDHYFRSVSYGKLGIDTLNSEIYPRANDSVYVLPHDMAYYHPYNQEAVYDERLVALFRDAIQIAYQKDHIDFSRADVIVVFHAGIGQDFALPFLDPTPEDIPSTFVDADMIQAATGESGIPAGPYLIHQGAILPETQNHLLYAEANPLLDAAEPCDYQYGLTGTLALMTGFALGFPPLWDTASGESGVGVFALMDQGSNNARGLVPAPPDAWSRIYAGWEDPISPPLDSVLVLPSRREHQLVKIPLTATEYFLVEARQNYWREEVSLDSTRYLIWQKTGRYPPLAEILIDSVPHTTDPVTGVITAFDSYDLGTPGTGLLIWHVDEERIAAGLDSYSINGDREHRGLDLEEADGAQDIGFPNLFITSDPSAGYFGDVWFRGNREYERVNPDFQDQAPEFGPTTYPDTRLNSGFPSYIAVTDISAPGDTMTFRVINERRLTGFPTDRGSYRMLADVNADGEPELVGGSGQLWLSTGPENAPEILLDTIGTKVELLLAGDALVAAEPERDSLRLFFWKPAFGPGPLVPIGKQVLPLEAGPHFLQGNRDSVQVTVFTASQTIVVTPDSFQAQSRSWSAPDSTITLTLTDSGSTGEGGIYLVRLESQGGIRMTTPAGESVLAPEKVFSQLMAADLNRDQLPEILAVDRAGTIYGWDVTGTPATDFPIVTDSVRVILCADVLGDERREIIGQKRSGEIIIWDASGKVQLTFGIDPTDTLIQVAQYQGQSILLCRQSAWIVEDSPHELDGWWALHQNLYRIRSLSGAFPEATGDETLLIQSQTYAYPNPAREGKVTLRFTVGSVESVEIEVFTLSGHFLRRWKISHPRPRLPQEIHWDVRGVTSGVYFAKVYATSGTKTESKILKIGILN